MGAATRTSDQGVVAQPPSNTHPPAGSRGSPPLPGPNSSQQGVMSLSSLLSPPDFQESSHAVKERQQQQQQHRGEYGPSFPGNRTLQGIKASWEQQGHLLSCLHMGSPSHHAPSPLHQIPPLSGIQTHGPAPPIPYANAPPGRENMPSGLRSISQPLNGPGNHSPASSPDEDDDDDDDSMEPDKKRVNMGKPPKPGRWMPGGRNQAGWYPQGGQAGGGIMAVPNAGTLIRDFVAGGGAEDGTGLALQIQPEGAEAIRVDVDMFQASKEADNKRKRNANASRRFRDRKKQEIQIIKEQNAELQRQNSDYKKELEDMEARLNRAHAERDFYRDERSRLHSIVRGNTDLLREAERTAPPTSPTMWSALPRHASSALPGPGEMQYPGSRGPSQPPYDAIYHGDDSSQGRMSLPPVRRRRTDQGPGADFGSASSYSSTPSQSPHQGPQHHITYGPGHPYGASGARATPSPRLGHQSHGDQRLPPLRLDHPAGGPHLGFYQQGSRHLQRD
ncbi:hypothetical protein RB597_008502 [Gaeumannomyces tritici]